MRASLIAGAIVALIATSSTAAPIETPPGTEVCEAAARIAAKAVGVPLPVLRAVMSTESSGHPWTLNIDGRPSLHPTPTAAAEAARSALEDGARNVDVGCFQISTRHHARAFRGIGPMLSPLRNALYAALYLQDLARTRPWPAAIACYHSCDPARGAAYLGRVLRRMETTVSK